MHTEVQVALKFVISFLYNKLPRRRVNLFGEELENALKVKFQGHWYPDKPFKGSAYRCLKITDPADPVLNRAAAESGNPLSDIIENLPADLAVWIDPGEVSYRMGEKGSVKILYSEKDSALNLEDINPEVRSFLSFDTLAASLNGLSLSQSSYGGSSPLSGPVSPPIIATSSPPIVNYPQNPFQPRQPPVVYTAASFAQTKFGSTKLKTNSKKPNRMSPTEFSNYIKQRALQKSIQQQQVQGQYVTPGHQSPAPPTNGFQDKFYGQNGFYSGSNSTNSNFNFNNSPKSLTSPSGGINSNDFNFGMGGLYNQNQLSPTPGSNNLNPSPTPGLNLSDYSNLFSDWDNETETNAFLQDILCSTGTVQKPGGQLSGFEDWISSSTPLGFNANQDQGLGPDSRSSSTKSMVSVTDSLPTPPSANEGFSQRVLVAN